MLKIWKEKSESSVLHQPKPKAVSLAVVLFPLLCIFLPQSNSYFHNFFFIEMKSKSIFPLKLN